MTLTEEEMKRLFLIERTLMEMLKDRGYLIDDSDITMTQEQFLTKYGDKMERKDLVTLKAKKNDDNDKLYIFFPNTEKIGVPEMKNYMNRLKKDNVFRAILVVQDIKYFTRFVKVFLSEISPKFYIEIFQEEELQMNVNKHVFVPHHQALTIEEKKTLLEKYTMKENQLPRILVTDPIAKYFGLKRGQVVKIIRLSETAGRYVTYRFVV